MVRTLTGRAVLGLLLAFPLLTGCKKLEESVVSSSAGVPVHFLDAQESSAYLWANGYAEGYTWLDYELRLKETFETEEQAAMAFREAEAGRMRDWTDGKRHALAGIAQSALERVADVAPCALPDTLRLALSTRSHEFGAYHTTGGLVVMPASEAGPAFITGTLGPVRASIEQTLIHEIFHVYSRLNPSDRDRLYALLGFRPAPDAEVPTWLRTRTITNPDAHPAYVLAVTDSSGRTFDAVLALYSDAERYEGYKGFASRLSILAGYAEKGFVEVGAGDEVEPVALDEVTGFLDRIGGLTDYTIAADEVLADAFEQLVWAGSADAVEDVSPEARALLRGVEAIVAAESCSVETATNPEAASLR